MPRRTTAVLVTCLVGAACSASWGGIAPPVISDSEFFNSDWTVIPRGYNFGGSATGDRWLGGGPDSSAARWTDTTAAPSFSGVYAAHIYTPFTYTPSLSGPLSGLAMSFDARLFGPIASLGFVVEQGDDVWFRGYTLAAGVWTTYSMSPSDEWFRIYPTQPYAPVGSGPDFSASGAPMRFGFYTGVGSGGSGAGAGTQVGVDNFRVWFVPAPGAAGTLGIAGMILARRRRR